jgi:hypothetical protein
MKKLLVGLLALGSISSFANDSKCSISESQSPDCYFKRDKAELNVGLIYYGNYWQQSDLERIGPKLKDKFYRATGGNLSLNIIAKRVIQYKGDSDTIQDLRKKRISYNSLRPSEVINEVYEEIKKSINHSTQKRIDALLVVTGAQFEGLSLAKGRISLTEQPIEAGWLLPSGGKTIVASDEQIIEGLIFGAGLNINLVKASAQCTEGSLEERRECCEDSNNKSDVLSFCKRFDESNVPSINNNFGDCNQGNIEKLIVPRILKGKKWKVNNKRVCS